MCVCEREMGITPCVCVREKCDDGHVIMRERRLHYVCGSTNTCQFCFKVSQCDARVTDGSVSWCVTDECCYVQYSKSENKFSAQVSYFLNVSSAVKYCFLQISMICCGLRIPALFPLSRVS